MRKAGLTGPRESAAATGRRLPAPGRGAVALRSLAAVSLLAALLVEDGAKQLIVVALDLVVFAEHR